MNLVAITKPLVAVHRLGGELYITEVYALAVQEDGKIQPVLASGMCIGPPNKEADAAFVGFARNSLDAYDLYNNGEEDNQ